MPPKVTNPRCTLPSLLLQGEGAEGPQRAAACAPTSHHVRKMSMRQRARQRQAPQEFLPGISQPSRMLQVLKREAAFHLSHPVSASLCPRPGKERHHAAPARRPWLSPLRALPSPGTLRILQEVPRCQAQKGQQHPPATLTPVCALHPVWPAK